MPMSSCRCRSIHGGSGRGGSISRRCSLTRSGGSRAYPSIVRRFQRVRRTISQVGLSPDQRRRNVAGAFRVPKPRADAIKDKKVVVIDDVITTAATAEACARALRRAGAARVDVLALAHAVEPTANTLA